MKFNNHDERIKYYELMLERRSLQRSSQVMSRAWNPGTVIMGTKKAHCVTGWYLSKMQRAGRWRQLRRIMMYLDETSQVMAGFTGWLSTTWLACKIYLDLGFCPIPENAVQSRDGWRIEKALTDHDALGEFNPATLEEIVGR